MSGISYAGEYDLREMKILTSAGNVIDVKNIVQVIEIFEDINSPSLSGNITILDIDNIMENAPMIGLEYLSLKISTPSLEEEMIDFGEISIRFLPVRLNSFKLIKQTIFDAIKPISL